MTAEATTVPTIAIALFLLPAALMAQAIVQHSVAAATGAIAGTMAGKKVSQVLDKALGATALAAGEKEFQWKKPGPPGPPTSGAIRRIESPSQWGGTAPGKRAPHRPRADGPLPEPGSVGGALSDPALMAVLPMPATLASVVRPPRRLPGEIVPDALREVREGAQRQEVLASLGTPASRVIIPESGHLAEVYYYQSNGETVGAVRLVDGAVSSVQINP